MKVLILLLAIFAHVSCMEKKPAQQEVVSNMKRFYTYIEVSTGGKRTGEEAKFSVEFSREKLLHRIKQCHTITDFCISYAFSESGEAQRQGYGERVKMKFIKKKPFAIANEEFTVYKFMDPGITEGIEDEKFIYWCPNFGVLITQGSFPELFMLNNTGDPSIDNTIKDLCSAIVKEQDFVYGDRFE